ncbi:MAG TPA: hypothetical protein VEK07_23855 [Polyangiaceae bacterium]|nr:hypothetical protein [Polyangiaceae bacterium]
MPISPIPRLREIRHAAVARLERAIDSAIEVLDRLAPTDRVRDLAERARELREQVGTWEQTPPSTEVRESVMRSALSLHLDAVALLRAASHLQGPAQGPNLAG